MTTTTLDHTLAEARNEAEDHINESEEVSFTLLLVVCLLIVCFMVAYLLRQVQPQVKFLHETGAAILFGAIIGAFVRFATQFSKLQEMVKFPSELFFMFLLPPIIFESGYFIKKTAFFSNMGSISVFAFLGTAISAFSFGAGLYLISQVCSLGLLPVECFIFGALISATDPVTVLAIFKELKVEKNLHANVFGESLFNDAVAIVLFRTFLTFAKATFTLTEVAMATLNFCLVFFGSITIGVVTAGMCSLLFKYTEMYKFKKLEGVFLLLYAYASYLLADGLNLSGIVAILCNGVTMAHYNYYNLSTESQKSTRMTVQTIASICEMFVFAYLGLALFSFKQSYDIVLIVASFVLALVTRALNVFPLSFLINLVRGKKSAYYIPMSHQTVLWSAGLRGAIAFALSLDINTPAGLRIHTTTLWLVLITAILFGGATGPLLLYLGVATKPDDDAGGSDDESETEEDEPAVDSCWRRFERKYVKTFFIRQKLVQEEPVGPDIIEMEDAQTWSTNVNSHRSRLHSRTDYEMGEPEELGDSPGIDLDISPGRAPRNVLLPSETI